MKTKTIALILGGAALAVGGYILYKRNLKKIEKQEAQEKEDFSELGIKIDKLDQDAIDIATKTRDYGDIRRFSDLPVPQQIVRLLQNSTNWEDRDLDWQSAVFSDTGAMNAVHLVFREGKDAKGGAEVGFFIEVPPIISNERSGNLLKYRDYVNYMNHLSQDFWAKHRVECTRPKFTDVIGLYSEVVEVTDGKTTAKILKYSKIPDNVLESRSRYSDRLDGLYCYYSDAKREAEHGVYIIPEDKDDIHLFMGIWFRMESPDRNYGGMTIKQILQFLEEMVIHDNYVIEDSNHKNRQSLGPVIVHPGDEFEYILDDELKIRGIEFGS